ncbi:MAG: RNA 2',3'-cyclic phosphodiesterase [Phycisphaerales bacterium]
MALTPDPPSATSLHSAAAAIAGALPPHRLIPTDQLHLTLAFIGETRAKEVREVKESVDRSCSGLHPFTLTAERLITIPTPDDGGPPRLLAAATDSPPTLLEIQRRIAQRLTRPKKNGRRSRFLPHITLARYRHGVSSDAIDQPLTEPRPSWRVESCTLYASHLKANGAEYEIVHTTKLN